MPSYSPAPIAQAPPGRFTPLVEAAKRGRLVLYLGAGISMAEPSCGPSGGDVADVLRPIVAQMLGVEEVDLKTLTLEALAQRVEDEDAERLEELRVRASQAHDFVGIVPSFGHEAAALLLREGATKLISVNWDCGVERAGEAVSAGIRSVAGPQESGEIVDGPAVFKVHGCASRPPSLAITQEDVDKPQTWAVGRVQGALADGIVAFVGLGTLGLYVCEPIASTVEEWSEGTASMIIADPVLSPAWEQAMGGAERAADSHLTCDADTFLDDLLRALVRDALIMSEQRIRALAQDEEWVKKMLDGFVRVREALGEVSADSVIRWWRDGVGSGSNGTPFITEQGGEWSLMTVGFLAGEDGGGLQASGSKGRQTLASGERYFEIVSKPGQPIAEVERVGRHRIQQRHAEGVYVDRKPVTAVVAGATGRFPSDQGRPDISASSADMTDLAEGAGAIPIHFFAAEDGVHGRLAE